VSAGHRDGYPSAACTAASARPQPARSSGRRRRTDTPATVPGPVAVGRSWSRDGLPEAPAVERRAGRRRGARLCGYRPRRAPMRRVAFLPLCFKITLMITSNTPRRVARDHEVGLGMAGARWTDRSRRLAITGKADCPERSRGRSDCEHDDLYESASGRTGSPGRLADRDGAPDVHELTARVVLAPVWNEKEGAESLPPGHPSERPPIRTTSPLMQGGRCAGKPLTITPRQAAESSPRR
jgi:hypothetical protein